MGSSPGQRPIFLLGHRLTACLQRDCDRKHPPGRKAYHRDPVRIWEIDGEVEKLYCQNLSLFGKFFIDVKTLFFDLDNCKRSLSGS